MHLNQCLTKILLSRLFKMDNGILNNYTIVKQLHMDYFPIFPIFYTQLFEGHKPKHWQKQDLKLVSRFSNVSSRNGIGLWLLVQMTQSSSPRPLEPSETLQIGILKVSEGTPVSEHTCWCFRHHLSESSQFLESSITSQSILPILYKYVCLQQINHIFLPAQTSLNLRITLRVSA